jgi:glycosyltransferase involved in cell wall biosynthesis
MNTMSSEASVRPVVLFTNSMVMGGMEEHVLQLGRGFVARGLPVAVICSPYEEIRPLREQLAASGVDVHPLPDRGRGPLGALRRFQALLQTLQRYKGCVLHMHFTGYRGGDLVVLAARLAGASKIVRSVHLPPVPPITRIDRTSITWRDRLLSRVICVSGPTRQAHLDDLGRDPHKCVVVHNGIDLQRFSPSIAGDGVRAELGLDHTAPLVCTVSRLGEERKGVKYFVEAAATIAQAHPQARFVVIGDGHLRPQLEAQAASLGIADKMIFTGERKDIARLLAAMDVFVIPSLYEACQYSLLEAMAMGKPVVATPAGVAPDVVLDHETGLLVPLADAPAIATAVTELLDDPALAARLGARARELMAQQFSVEVMLDNITRVYDEAA